MFLDVSTVEERKHTVCLQSSRCSTTLSTIRIAGTESAEHFLASKWRNKKRERERVNISLLQGSKFCEREYATTIGNFVFVAIFGRSMVFDPIEPRIVYLLEFLPG